MSDDLDEREIDAEVDAAIRKHRARRGRCADDVDDLPAVQGRTRTVRMLEIDGRRYEQTYVRCGKKCSVCDADSAFFDPEHPGHGPYWYLLISRGKGKTIRRYIGRKLVSPTPILEAERDGISPPPGC